ncbi:hypothetical protein NADFUDRAFT_46263 [Nadsonia fulvescens var. elongata DSM 6958]|uniref:Uncharacterized protein n=1 Tax=Nadsonia fulvescens var. elongata DSM 6958 TaxID=857566 RepID=A0A1E3PJH7_9ASCO|nr:hypothetical protein NADFUDRAFT_46263 [Nadsonia fulvescens var. elongata DSM 6958]
MLKKVAPKFLGSDPEPNGHAVTGLYPMLKVQTKKLKKRTPIRTLRVMKTFLLGCYRFQQR